MRSLSVPTRPLMQARLRRRRRPALATNSSLSARRTTWTLISPALKGKDEFLSGVDAIVEAIESGKIEIRVYHPDKFHAKCYITYPKKTTYRPSALVGSSNFTYPGLHENVELNVRLDGNDVAPLQEWYNTHWNAAHPWIRAT